MSATTKLCPKCSAFNDTDAFYCKSCGFHLINTEIKEDKIYYQDNNVLISLTRYTAFNMTYVMRDITSVGLTVEKPSRTLPILIWIFALIQAFALNSSVFVKWHIDNKYIASGIFILIGFVVNSFYKNKYHVTISNKSGQVNTIHSTDQSYIQSIVNSINQAIVERG